MELYVLNEDFQKVALIDNFESLMWIEKSRDIGEFEIKAPATQDNLYLLQKGYHLKRNDRDGICKIEQLEIDTDVESGNYILAKGRDLKYILYQRVIDTAGYEYDPDEEIYIVTKNIVGDFKKVIDGILKCNIGEVASPYRRYTPDVNLAFGTNFPEDEITFNSNFENLGEKISELCTTYKINYSVTLGNNIFIYFWVDKDKTSEVVFSPRFDNVSNSTYSQDFSTYKNFAYVTGVEKSEEGNRYQANIYNTAEIPSGKDRNEVHLDLSSTEKGEETTEQEYLAMLRSSGRDELAKNVDTINFTVEIVDDYYKYKQDYDIGDIVTIETGYGYRGTATIIEVNETFDINGYTVTLNLEY